MSATRLLVLGVVRGYGTTYGYEVGTTLLGWGAAEWANVKWGSIYHALRSLTREGFLSSQDGFGRTNYELTQTGHREFLGLLRDAVRRPVPHPDLMGAALALLPALPRAEALELLRERLAAYDERRAEARDRAHRCTEVPHVWELFGLWESAAVAGARFTRELSARLKAGSYVMAGEAGSPGDPGSWPGLIGEGQSPGADPAVGVRVTDIPRQR